MSQRQAAMVLLDAVSAFDPHQGDTPENEAAVRLALKRLTEVDAISATRDDEAGVTRVNADPLIIGALSIITLLVGTIAEDRGADRAAVLSTIREIVGPTFDN